ncbi:hypothetical protein [Kutzneria sp. CA-103260]|uniref:hypothetical protein n=1 Tax=Kutzneria sp. CA-103260 TaxID=2802641 RepID=UPI001BA831D1|nr:hypothetical protein [Kutzneria sp. CA-103260]
MAPARTDQAGADLAALVEQAQKTTAALFGSTDIAAAGNSGWLSATALTTCGQKWHDHLKSLENTTSALAWSVRKAARLYNTADQEAQRRLQEVLENMTRQ